MVMIDLHGNIAERKAAMGYLQKASEPPMCKNCVYFQSDMQVKKSPYVGQYTEEKSIRCNLGGFAVKKMAVCAMHERKE